LKQLHLLGHILKLVQTLQFCFFEVKQFVLFELFEFEFVFNSFKHLVLAGNFFLGALELLLEDTFALLTLSKLLPQSTV